MKMKRTKCMIKYAYKKKTRGSQSRVGLFSAAPKTPIFIFSLLDLQIYVTSVICKTDLHIPFFTLKSVTSIIRLMSLIVRLFFTLKFISLLLQNRPVHSLHHFQIYLTSIVSLTCTFRSSPSNLPHFYYKTDVY